MHVYVLLVPLSTSGWVSSPLQTCFLSQYFGYKANCLLLSFEQRWTCWGQILLESTRDSPAAEQNFVILMLKRFCFSVLLVAQQKNCCSPYSNRHWTEFIPNSILQSYMHKLPFLLLNKASSNFPRFSTLTKARCLYCEYFCFVQNNGKAIRKVLKCYIFLYEVLYSPLRHAMCTVECHRQPHE